MVIAPLTAASLLNRRSTVLVTVLALVAATALGLYDRRYLPESWPTQATRLFGVARGP